MKQSWELPSDARTGGGQEKIVGLFDALVVLGTSNVFMWIAVILLAIVLMIAFSAFGEVPPL